MNSVRNGIVFVSFSGVNRGREGVLYTGAEVAPAKILESEHLFDSSIFHVAHSDSEGQSMSAVFTRAEVCRLFGMTDGRLKYWDQTGFISPTGQRGQKRCYTFQDLIAIRSARALLESGVTVQRTRRIIEQLEQKLPKTTHPLSKLRIRGDAGKIVVAESDHEFEATSGQLLIDFSVSAFEEEILSKLPEHNPKATERSAYDWYLEGCEFDEDENMLQRAEEAYHRAIHLDPTLANAYTNLGNLRYRLGAADDARALYMKAIEVDDNQPEAHYNLGFLEFERGALESARSRFSRAVALDPTFADAQFNLGMTLLRLDDKRSARDYLKRYLALESTGHWAEIARTRLQEL